MDYTAFESDSSGQSHPVQIAPFDWESMAEIWGDDDGDSDAEFTRGDLRAAQQEAVRKLIAIAILTKQGEIRPAQAIGVQMLSLGYLMEIKPGVTMEEMAAPSGLTRAGINKPVSALRDFIGTTVPAQKKHSARSTYAEAQRRTPKHKRGPRKQGWAGFDAVCSRVVGPTS